MARSSWESGESRDQLEEFKLIPERRMALWERRSVLIYLYNFEQITPDLVACTSTILLYITLEGQGYRQGFAGQPCFMRSKHIVWEIFS